MNDKNASGVQTLKNISQRDLLNFGVREVAYIRSINLPDRMAYAIHAADGTPLSVMDTIDQAMVALRNNDLERVSVH
jgi:hypothetical protein